MSFECVETNMDCWLFGKILLPANGQNQEKRNSGFFQGMKLGFHLGFRFAGFCKLCYVTRAFGRIPLEINRLPPHSP